MYTDCGRNILCVAVASLLITAFVGGCESTKDTNDDRLALVHNGVQLAWVHPFSWTGAHIQYLTSASRGTLKGRSTGAIRHVSPNSFEGTCGATFISHHYAVTAAHCIKYLAFGSTSPENYSDLRIEQYDTTNLTANDITQQATVSGNYNDPNGADKGFPFWKRFSPLSNYIYGSYACQIAARCQYGHDNSFPNSGRDSTCPSSIASGQVTRDTALLYCSSRTLGLGGLPNYVPFRPTPDTNRNLDVEVWWFHEIVNLSTCADGYWMCTVGPVNNAAHYFTVTNKPNGGGTDYANNYHYLDFYDYGHQQPLPLLSTWAGPNVKYHELGNGDDTYIDTNVLGCHGMSGSGVFEANTDYLIGHINNQPPNAPNLDTHICDTDLLNLTEPATKQELSIVPRATDINWMQYQGGLANGGSSPPIQNDL